MLLKVDNLGKSFGERGLFSRLSFFVDKNECLAVVGRNGCGKSTLLKILNGETEADEGSFTFDDIKVCYLAQESKELDSRSGGERTRDALNEIFDKKPSFIILDEPTNHLDVAGITLLEERLKSFRGGIILVSHDRYLIDNVATKVLDMNTTPCKVYKGNYSAYTEQKDHIIKSIENENKKIAAKIDHEKKVIEKLKSFNREKSIKRAESREKMLARISLREDLSDKKTKININLEPSVQSGNDVLSFKEVSKSFGDRLLFKDATFDLRRGEHVGLIGGNGTGKTTIFNIIREKLPPDSGKIKLGTNVSVGYFDQNLLVFNEENTLFNEVQGSFSYLNDTKVRNTLAAFSFFDEDAFKVISSLSGGEKGRLALCKLMLSEDNLLLLDEPTNHLDMESREILEDALNVYEGTVLVISHDRFFLNKCADRILDLDNGEVRNYLGNYDDYLSKKRELKEKGIIKANKEPIKEEKTLSNARLKWEEEKQQKALIEKREREEKRLLAQIEETENEIKEIEKEESDPAIASDFVKLKELMDRRIALEDKLYGLYDKLYT